MGDFEFHQWFNSDELTPCPACGEQAGIRLPASGSFLCMACGQVGTPADGAALNAEQDKDMPAH